jgi:hypothetical protein
VIGAQPAGSCVHLFFSAFGYRSFISYDEFGASAEKQFQAQPICCVPVIGDQ